jgi:dolichol-phosphate mannosyltransferase
MRRPAAQVAAMIVAMAIVKAAISIQTELTSAECYLWMCAKRPALGYFDYPALVAWMIWLSTALFGESVLAVRLFTIAGGGLMTWFVFLAARRLYDERVARLAAFLVGLAPLTWAYGAEALCDAPMLLFWSAALWALAHVFSGGRPAWWYAAGVFLGLSMLGKYHGVFLGVGALVFLVFSPDHRSWLRRKEPYLAALLAIAAFSPTIIWNWMNGWESFRYQGVSRFGEHGSDWKQRLEFPYKQLVLMTPFVCLWAWGSGLRTLHRWKSSSWQDRFAAAMGMPVLLFFLAIVFLRPVRGHWPIPGYLSVLILSAASIQRGDLWGRRLNVKSLAVMAGVYLAAPVALAFWPRADLSGWSQLANRVREMRPDFVIANEYHHASQMGYLLQPIPAVEFTAVGEPSKNFPHWWRGADYAGRDAIVLYDAKHDRARIDLVLKCFDRLEEPVPFIVGRAHAGRWGSPTEEFLLIRARGYRPIPSDH